MAHLFARSRAGHCSDHVGMHPTSRGDTPPSLVVIGGGRRGAARAPAAAPVDAAFVGTLPAARQVLWIGDDAGARAYAERHPDARCMQVAAEPAFIAALDGNYELIVLDSGLAAWPDPAACLEALAQRAAPQATLALELPNHATLAMLQRWAEADLTDDDGALAHPQLALGSMGSAYKLLMDANWMPTLVHTRAAPPVPPSYEEAALGFAAALAIPRSTAQRQWRAASWIVHAQRCFDAAPAAAEAALFDVVVPTTRERQLRANVECSPGLSEVAARVVSVRRATDPAAAMAIASRHLGADWVLLTHQDVYFPRGFGRRLNALLAGVKPKDRPHTLIGFAGIGVDAARQGVARAGFVIDRTTRADWGANDQAVSIDELAIVVARDSVHRIDPALGWHLWATDLCLAAITRHQVFPRIVRLPLFHNSLTDHTLPPAFHASAATLAAKYPDWGPIHTLCGVIHEPPRSVAA